VPRQLYSGINTSNKDVILCMYRGRILLFTQTVSLISKVNVENATARVNLRNVS